MASLPFAVPTASLSLVSSANLLGIHLISLSMSWIKMFKNTGLKMCPEGHHSSLPVPGHRASDHSPLTVTTQPILYPLNCPPFKSLSIQFRSESYPDLSCLGSCSFTLCKSVCLCLTLSLTEHSVFYYFLSFNFRIIPIFLVHRPANNIPYATVEEELIGEFVKYSVKDGKEINFLRRDSEAGQKCCTFQHWVYEKTNGNLLVTDLQGELSEQGNKMIIFTVKLHRCQTSRDQLLSDAIPGLQWLLL